jgi:hypothetical protein
MEDGGPLKRAGPNIWGMHQWCYQIWSWPLASLVTCDREVAGGMVAGLILYSIMQGITLIQDVWKRPIEVKSSADRHVFVKTVNPKNSVWMCLHWQHSSQCKHKVCLTHFQDDAPRLWGNVIILFLQYLGGYGCLVNFCSIFKCWGLKIC